MSRTDRHRPWWVQRDDPLETAKFIFYQRPGEENTVVFLFRNCKCTTWWCCMSEPNRHERRRSRHQAQRSCREALKGADE